ncbi:hypothetical protein [Actinomadura sp. 6N118]|uniref:hypothetical protein n=1 Tax=Actinomadura sp. 6N118 TaxID=3375151 RepID=UPI0037A564B8
MSTGPLTPPPDCAPVHRPAKLLASGAPAHGLRAAGTRRSGADRILDIWLYGNPPAGLAVPRRWALVPAPGGRRVGVAAAAVATTPGPPHIELKLTSEPDPGRYLLVVFPERAAEPGVPALPLIPFDPLRTRLPVRLRPECPDLGGCFTEEPAPPARPPVPVHDYLARDWRSLRAALVEFLRREDPAADLSPADPTITVLELFAHLGDLLHYRLDRVATEAYLDTARLRTSVRRHARLVDYEMAEAAAASTLVLLQPSPTGGAVTVAAGDTAVATEGDRLGFVLEEGRTAHPAVGEIAIYDWGEDVCCLPAGATECVLVRPLPTDTGPDSPGGPWLQPGDRLVFEVIDPEDRVRHRDWAARKPGVIWPAADSAGRPRFRDPLPSRTAATVTLTEVADLTDPLAPAGMRLSLVRWRAADALPRGYPVSIDTGAGGDEVTVARGNLVPAHHGRLVAGASALAPRAHGAAGEYALTAAGPGAGGPGVALRSDGRPYRLGLKVTLPSGALVDAEHVRSLLEVTSPGRLAYVLDTEEHEPPILRFRTGALGLAPPTPEGVAARYEIGGGTAGNIPANVLSRLEHDNSAAGFDTPPSWRLVTGLVARNPLTATGGRDAVALEVVRRDAPEAFAAAPRRAVTVADHAAEAARVPGVQGAVAERAWSGSWPVVRTVVDLLGAPEQEAADLAAITARLEEVRMLGTEIAVSSGTAAGLLLSLRICAVPGADPETVRRAALTALRPGTDERPGLFHPSRLELGRPVYVSAALAVVAALPGVDAVELLEARRLGEPAGTVHQVITVAGTELPVLDDDPVRPERGRLDITVRGGS